jgi:hypothetical protein
MIVSRFSRPSRERRAILTFPETMMYSRSPGSPSANSVCPRGKSTPRSCLVSADTALGSTPENNPALAKTSSTSRSRCQLSRSPTSSPSRDPWVSFGGLPSRQEASNPARGTRAVSKIAPSMGIWILRSWRAEPASLSVTCRGCSDAPATFAIASADVATADPHRSPPLAGIPMYLPAAIARRRGRSRWDGVHQSSKSGRAAMQRAGETWHPLSELFGAGGTGFP